jgi:hypothetical protein
LDVTKIDTPEFSNSRGTTRITLPDPPKGDKPRGKRSEPASHEEFAASYGVVYVNELARQALLEQKKPQFPVGSIIVREKLLQPDAAKPQLLVAMVKRERGFNRKANDWEFLMIDGSVSQITQREKTGSCRDCHKRQKDTDFVYRTYLPETIRLSQK